MNISGLSTLHQNLLVQSSPVSGRVEEKSGFGDMLMEAVRNVSRLEKESDSITDDFIAGRTDNIHSVLIAAEKASISLDMVIEVRNKVLEAYNEIMRMQV